MPFRHSGLARSVGENTPLPDGDRRWARYAGDSSPDIAMDDATAVPVLRTS